MKKITLLLLSVFVFALQGNAQYFTENFENSGDFPTTWTHSTSSETWAIDEGTDFGPGAAQAGTYAAFFNDYDYSSGVSSQMITPSIDLSSATAPELTFYYVDSGGSDVVNILVSTDGTTYTSVFTTDGTVDGWTKQIISLATYAGEASVTIAFEGTSVYGTSNPHIDTVSIHEAPSCSDPMAIAMSNITMTSADLAWTAGGTETMWEVVYAATPYTQPSNSMTDASAEPGYAHVTATSLSLSSLTASTTYDVYYRGHCGGTDYSNWVTASFSTLAQGATCETAIPVANLPYNTSDDTANYGDDYSGTPGASGCGTTSNYLNGDDVVYAYTATADGSINIALSSIGSTYSGMFVYTDCADIGTACVAGAGDSSSDDFAYDVAVTNGTTYYVVISTYASPQSTTYTLDITQNTCTSATADFAVVSDCDVSGGFNIEVAISDMGSATGLTVSDDQGSDSQAATAAGTLTFGPYYNGTVVVISMVDDSDATCAITAALTQENCPPANNFVLQPLL